MTTRLPIGKTVTLVTNWPLPVGPAISILTAGVLAKENWAAHARSASLKMVVFICVFALRRRRNECSLTPQSGMRPRNPPRIAKIVAVRVRTHDGAALL